MKHLVRSIKLNLSSKKLKMESQSIKVFHLSEMLAPKGQRSSLLLGQLSSL